MVSPTETPPEKLARLFPSRASRFCSHFPTLLFGHGLHASLPANLSALAAYGSHIIREVGGRRRGCRPKRRFRILLRRFSLICRLVNNPLGELVGITRAFALKERHVNNDATRRMLKRGCGFSN